MVDHWVLNASPLIVLARIGREDLFFSLAEQVVVPRAVVEEIQAGPAHDPARQVLGLIGSLLWIHHPRRRNS